MIQDTFGDDAKTKQHSLVLISLGAYKHCSACQPAGTEKEQGPGGSSP